MFLLKNHIARTVLGARKEKYRLNQKERRNKIDQKKTEARNQAKAQLDSWMADLLKPPARQPEQQPTAQTEPKTHEPSIQQKIQALKDKINAARREREPRTTV